MVHATGRGYHKHYQSLRKKHSFEELCKKPELAAETALGPIEDFDFDVAILLATFVVALQAMGMNLVFDPGPKFEDILTEQNFKKQLHKRSQIYGVSIKENPSVNQGKIRSR